MQCQRLCLDSEKEEEEVVGGRLGAFDYLVIGLACSELVCGLSVLTEYSVRWTWVVDVILVDA